MSESANRDGTAGTAETIPARVRLRDLLSLFAPLPYDRRLTPDEIVSMSRARSVALVLVVFIDGLITVGLWGRPTIRNEALEFFFFANLLTMTIDAALTWWLLSRGRATWLLGPMVVVEMFATVSWIQLTGLTTSYFVYAPVVILAFYRMIADYRTAMIGLVASTVFYLGAAALEQAGVIRASSLFVEAPRVDAVYQVTVIISVMSFSILAFAAASYLVLRERRRDAALDAAREKLRKTVAADRIGRLSGVLVGGDFQLFELLGRGGMGEVYRGERISDSSPVAIKIMHPYLALRDRSVQRFQREAEVAAQLGEEVAVPVHQVGVTDEGDYFIAMDHLIGEDLAAYLRRHDAISTEDALALIDEIARCLDRAHEVGVVHRDLKPSNVFLRGGSERWPDLRLLDFGIARLAEASETLTDTHAVLGSPGYLAPEQAMGGSHEIDGAADIFALGAIAYRLLTGEDPFPSRNAAKAIYAAINVQPPPPTTHDHSLHEDVDRLFVLALAKDPKKRPRSAGELARLLRVALAGELPDEQRARADELRRLPGPLDDTLSMTARS